MASLIRSLTTWSDGSVRESVLPVIPMPQPVPDGGTQVLSGMKFVYVVHDDLTLGFARTLLEEINIAITNEIFVPRRWYFRTDIWEWRVDQYSKISFWPEELEGGWYPYFFSGMTERQHGLFDTRSFGWRDTGFALVAFFKTLLARMFKRSISGFRPDGVAIYNFLLCGGALLRKSHEWRQWTIFICQDTNFPPGWDTYIDAPDKVFKQGVCGHNAEKQSFYGSVNQQQGDLFVPTACPGGYAAILTRQVRPVPEVPLDTILDGVLPVRIVELRIRASEIFGKTDTGEWYYILEQRTKNGNQADFVLHAPPELFPALPVPYVEWQLS